MQGLPTLFPQMVAFAQASQLSFDAFLGSALALGVLFSSDEPIVPHLYSESVPFLRGGRHPPSLHHQLHLVFTDQDHRLGSAASNAHSVGATDGLGRRMLLH